MSSTIAQQTQQHPGLSKKAAFLIHFCLSVLIFMTLVAVMAVFWFPGELFFLDGGWQGLKIVALIDIVLGPALTLLLYSPGKPKLVLDMSMIALLQIGALVFGFVTTYQQRTVAIVYADDTFNTLSAAAMKEANQNLEEKNLLTQIPKDLDNSTPAMLFSPGPAPGEFAQYVNELLNGYPEPHERSDKFKPLLGQNATLEENALSVEILEEINMDKLVLSAMEKNKLKMEDVQFHPFKTRFASGVVIVNAEALNIIDYVPLPKNELEPSTLETAESASE